MLISTCAWLRTAVCSSDNGPLLISQLSCKRNKVSTPSHHHHQPLPSPPSVLGQTACTLGIRAKKTYQLSNLILSLSRGKMSENQSVSISPSGFQQRRASKRRVRRTTTHVHSLRGFWRSALWRGRQHLISPFLQRKRGNRTYWILTSDISGEGSLTRTTRLKPEAQGADGGRWGNGQGEFLMFGCLKNRDDRSLG